MHQLVASRTTPTGDLAHNTGLCPDLESNWQPLGSQAGTQSTEPHQPGLFFKSEDIFVDFTEEGVGGKKNINQLPPLPAPTRDQTRILSMCPDQEPNPYFCVQDNTPTEPPCQSSHFILKWLHLSHSLKYQKKKRERETEQEQTKEI